MAGEVRRLQQRASAWEIEAVVVKLVKAELIRQQIIVIAAGLLLKVHGVPLTQEEMATKYVHGRLADAWELLFPSELIWIIKLLIERVDLALDGLAVKWRDLERSEFVNECTKFGIFDQLSNQQPATSNQTLTLTSPHPFCLYRCHPGFAHGVRRILKSQTDGPKPC